MREECRALARALSDGEHRDQLLHIARMRKKLAADRSQLIRNHPELGTSGEHEEEIGRL